MCSHKVEKGEGVSRIEPAPSPPKPHDLKVHKVFTKQLSSLFDLSFKELLLHIFTHDSKWVPVGIVSEEKGIFEYAKIADIKTQGISEDEIEHARSAPSKEECAHALGDLIRQKRIKIEPPVAQRLENLIQKANKHQDDYELQRVISLAESKNIDVKAILPEKIRAIYDKYIALRALLPNDEKYKLLKLCIFAETALENIAEKTGAIHVKKGPEKLPYSLLIDFEKKTYSVLLKSKGPIEARGASGKVTSIIEVLPNSQARFAVQKVNLDDATLSPFAIECEKKYGGVHTCAVYFKGNIQKTTCTYEGFECDLVEAANSDKIKTIGDVLSILSFLASTLKRMHEDGVIHGDVKVENGLFKRIKDFIIAKLIDFELAYKPEEGGAPVREEGYGTSIYTSPEVILNSITKKPDYKLDERKAQDMYALGMVALLLLQNKFDDEVVEWLNKVQDNMETFYEKAPNTRIPQAVEIQWLQTVLPQDRLKGLRKKERKEELSLNEKLEQLVFSMLHPNPEKRMTVHELIDAIDELQFDFRDEIKKSL